MKLSRREFIRLAGLVAAGASLAACQPLTAALAGEMPAFPAWPAADPGHFRALSRLTFGPRVEERLRAQEIGLQGWIEEQLAYETLDDAPAELRLLPLRTLEMSATELIDGSSKLFGEYDHTGVPAELRQATLLRQVYSRRQLYEVMAEFWSDHFSLSVDKGDVCFLKTVDDREVIRRHTLGSFRDLLWASAHSPAMLVYLDNQANHKGAPNENYARELMELHTLGVHGGYTQSDVMELARCLTGWTVKEHFWRGQFAFDADLHDPDAKTVLGMAIPPGGQGEAEGVLDRLAEHPATAQFIAAKLVRRLAADDPPPELVQRAAAAFTRSHGDIRAVLRAILLDGGGLSSAPLKYKRPANFVVSALRMLNAQTDGGAPLQEALARMGQAYFSWPTPDGFPDTAAAWQAGLMPRWQMALALARDELPGTSIHGAELARVSGAVTPAEWIDQLSLLLLGAPLAATVRDDLAAALQAGGAGSLDEIVPLVIAGLLSSPAFQWR